MKIEVDLKKKYVLAIVGIAILFFGLGFSLANPRVFGHKSSEIEFLSE